MFEERPLNTNRITILCLSLLFCTTLAVSCRKEESPAGGISEVSLWARVGHSRDFEIRKIDEWNQGPGEAAGIRIAPRFFGGDYDEALLAAKEAGNLPDLFQPRDRIAQWVKEGDLRAIEDLEGGELLIEKYRKFLVEDIHVFDGKTYSIPSVANTFRLAVNRDLLRSSGFENLPSTWEEVRLMAAKVTLDSDGNKRGIVFPMKWGSDGEYFWKLGMIYGFSNSLGVDSWYNRETRQPDFPAMEPMLSFIRGIKQDKSYLPGTESLDNDEARKAFSTGTVAFIPAASWDYGVYTHQFPIEDRFDWTVMEFPGTGQFKTPLSSGIRLAGSVSADSRVDPEKISEVFTGFLYNDEILKESYSLGLYLPLLTHLTEEPPEEVGPQWKNFAPTLHDGPEYPNPDGLISAAGVQWPEVFSDIWNDDKISIEETLEDLDRHYTDMIAAFR